MDLLKRANWIGTLQMIEYYDENVKHQVFFQSMYLLNKKCYRREIKFLRKIRIPQFHKILF